MLKKCLTLLAAGALCLSMAAPGSAQDFDWKKYSGTTLIFIGSNHPWYNAIMQYKQEFTDLTGITLRTDPYSEEQARQRMLTTLRSKGTAMDLFMSLKSRDGLLYSKAGWYADLTPYTKSDLDPNYNMDDFGKGALEGEIFDGKLTGIPLNVEGPVLYYRKDILEKLGVNPPATLDELEALCKLIKEQMPDMTPITMRGLKSAIPFTFSVFLHNMGGEYVTEDAKSNLSAPETKAAIDMYARLLRDYGPPGAVNNSFYQVSALYREGKAVMAFESSNELNSMMEGGERLKDTGIMLLPSGAGGNHPTVIGWGISASNFSRHKEATWYFIQWATSAEMQERLIKDGIMPPRISALNSPTFEAWKSEAAVRQEWADAIVELSDKGTSNVMGPNVVNQPEGRDIVGQVINDVMLGTRSLDDACANGDRLLNVLLEKQDR